MAHIGKIACHFPDYPINPNHDVEEIKILPAGTVIPAGATDAQIKALLARVNKVYAIPAGATVSSVADLQQYVVWTWLDDMVAGSETVAIEYTPTSDVTLNSIGIYTDSNDTNTTCNVVIYHESGLVVYRNNVDTVDAVTTKYMLTGRRRHIDGISGVTLKAGMKYYVQYTQKNHWNNNTFFPAYYDNVAGNYKVWYYGDAQSKQMVNMASLNDYKGEISDSAAIFGMTAGDFFIWNGSSNIGMTPGNCYVRSGVGQTYTFTGIIGDPTSHHNPVTGSNIVGIMNRPMDTEFIWYCHQQNGMQFGQIWAKTVNTTSWTSVNNSAQNYEVCEVLHALNTALVAVTLNNCYGWFTNGDKVELKSGYTSQVTSDTPLSSMPPVSDLVANGLYCVMYNGNPCAVIFDGTSYTYLTQKSDLLNYITITELYNWLDYVCDNSDLLSNHFTDSSIVDAVRDNTTYPVYNTKKYYLEINGNEV